jgi:hypothetical protein
VIRFLSDGSVVRSSEVYAEWFRFFLVIYFHLVTTSTTSQGCSFSIQSPGGRVPRFSRGVFYFLKVFGMMATPMVREAPWRLDRKAVLIHAPDLDNVGCLAHVNISYDQMKQEGYITIKINLKLAGFNDEYQAIHLNIFPGAINACSVTLYSYKNMLPNELLTKLKGVKEASAVTTLSLQLREPSIVLVPSGLPESISPVDPSDGDFYAISRISRAKSIRLHYSKQDFPSNDQLRLQKFASALTKNALSPPRVNYSHFNGGTGAQERDWTVFDQPSPLPTYNQVVLPAAMLGKRSRCEDAAPDLISHPSCSQPPPPGSPTEVCSSFGVDMLTGAVDPDGASSPPVIRTPFKVRPLTQDVLPVERDLYDTQSTSTACSPAMSAESRHIQEMSPSNIVPTVFHKGRFEPDSIAEPPRYKKKRPRLVSPPEDMPTVREIIQDVVDKEKQSILTEHQEMCDEAEIRVAEAIDDGRTAIIEKTDECCDEIDDHGQKIREACEESCEMLQVDVACLEEASTVLEKTWARFLSAFDSVVLTSGRLDCRLSHPSTLAARIITEDFEHLATSDKVTMLTRVADTGFANVFLAVNHELRKELVTAW